MPSLCFIYAFTMLLQRLSHLSPQLLLWLCIGYTEEYHRSCISKRSL